VFRGGDVCETVPKYANYSLVCIIRVIDGTHYEFETEKGVERCNVNSILAKSFKLLASDMSSLAEFKSTHPEYFV